MHLNSDCWRLVLAHFSNDAQTLFKLLLVSSQFFEITVRILYAQPLALPHSQPIPSRRSFSDGQIRDLILSCKLSFGVLLSTPNEYSPQQQKQLQQQHDQLLIKEPTFAQSKPPTPTVNYDALARPVNDQLSLFSSAYSFTSRKDRCGKVKELTILVKELEQILDLASCFSTLEILRPYSAHEWDDSFVHYPTENEVQVVIQFVRAHKSAFPGLLQRVGCGSDWENFDQFCRIQQALDPVQVLSLVIHPGTNLLLLPKTITHHIRFLSIIVSDTIPIGGTAMSQGFLDPDHHHHHQHQLSDFLSKCQSLQHFTGENLKSDVFKWAVVEQDSQSQDLSLPQYHPPSQWLPLPPPSSSSPSPSPETRTQRLKEQPKDIAGENQRKDSDKWLKYFRVPRNPEPDRQASQKVVRIKEMNIMGSQEILLDVMIGFQEWLEKVIFTITSTTTRTTTMSAHHNHEWIRWNCLLPRLTELEINNPSMIDLSCLEPSCPNLKILRIDCCLKKNHQSFEWRQQGTWKAPKKLKILKIKGKFVTLLELKSLKALVGLESLDLQVDDDDDGDDNDRDGEAMKNSAGLMDWINGTNNFLFLFLTKVILKGFPANVIQGQILKVAPHLEEYSVRFSRQFSKVGFQSFMAPNNNNNTTTTTTTTAANNNNGQDVLDRVSVLSLSPSSLPSVQSNHSCLGILSILNVKFENYTQTLFEDLFRIERDDKNHQNNNTNKSENMQQGITRSTSSSLPVALLPSKQAQPQRRRFIYFPNLEHLSLEFRDCEIQRFNPMIFNMLRVDSLMTLTLSGTLYDSWEGRRRHGMGERIFLRSRLDDSFLLEPILNEKMIGINPKMRKACILQLLSKENNGSPRYYWLPSASL